MTSQPQPDWYDAANQVAVKAHLDACIAAAERATVNDPIATRFEQNKLADLCMLIRSYRHKDG
jgi:hypothetical protein